MRSGSIGAAPGVRPDATPPELPGRHVLGVIHARAGQLPPGAGEVISEAGGSVLIVGDGAAGAATAADPASHGWWCDPGRGLQPGRLASPARYSAA